MHIIGGKVILRNVRLSDAGIITTWKRDPFIKRMALDPRRKIKIATEKGDIKSALNSSSQIYLVIERKESKEPIGYIRINWMDIRKSCAWLRFVLGKSRGEGFAKDAVNTLLHYLFSKDLHRIDAEVYAFNTRSLKLLHRLGFQTEGIRRKAHYYGRKYYDVIVLGLLKKDFFRD